MTIYVTVVYRTVSYRCLGVKFVNTSLLFINSILKQLVAIPISLYKEHKEIIIICLRLVATSGRDRICADVVEMATFSHVIAPQLPCNSFVFFPCD